MRIMTELKNAMEIFKKLPRTNCKECGIPTCFAFAAAVFKGDKRLCDCTHVDKAVIENYSIANSDSRTLEREEAKAVEELRSRVAEVDLAAAAERLGGVYSGEHLTLKMLGKDFHIDQNGVITSLCHIHGWLTIPMLNYILESEGKTPVGEWTPFRELKDGWVRAGLFEQRCEKPLKRIADVHTDLFEFMVQIFSAKHAPRAFNSDIAVTLYPLPKVPMLICYWRPEGDMQSSVNIFFDKTAADNLPIDSIYRITAGIVMMFEKIVVTHAA